MTALLDDVDEGLAWTSEGCVGMWRLGTADSLGLGPSAHQVATWEQLAAGLAQLPRSTVLHGVTRPLATLQRSPPRSPAPPPASSRSVAVSPAWQPAGGNGSSMRLLPSRSSARCMLRRTGSVPASGCTGSEQGNDRTAGSAANGTWWPLPPVTCGSSRPRSMRSCGCSRGSAPPPASARRLGASGGCVSSRALARPAGPVAGCSPTTAPPPPTTPFWWSSTCRSGCSRVGESGGEPATCCGSRWSGRCISTWSRTGRPATGSRRRLAELDYQDEKENEYESAPPRELVKAIDTVEAAIDQLANNAHIPLAQPTMVFWVSGDTLEDVEFRAETVRSLFEGSDITVVRPLGAQRRLLQSMVPGSPVAAPSQGLGAADPPQGPGVGSPGRGVPGGGSRRRLLGMAAAGGDGADSRQRRDETAADRDPWTCRPVYFDAAEGPATNRTGAAAFIGDQGAGKSMTSKKLARDVVARGGRVVVYDPTEQGEWARWAQAVTADPLVVTLDGNTAYNLDPLRIFTDRAAAERYGLGLLSLLTGTPATGSDATTLRAAVADVLDANGGLTDVPAALRTVGDAGQRLADDIDTVLNTAMGRALLSGTGRPVTSDEQVVVFRIPSLSLPTEDELSTEWGRRQLLPEQIMGQGVVYLMAAVARELTMTKRRVRRRAVRGGLPPGARSSPQGRTLVLGWVRDSRKHNASVWLLSQSIHDTDEELRSLLRNRFVFRQGKGLGAAALEWLGLPASRELIDLVEARARPRRVPVPGPGWPYRDRASRTAHRPSAGCSVLHHPDQGPLMWVRLATQADPSLTHATALAFYQAGDDLFGNDPALRLRHRRRRGRPVQRQRQDHGLEGVLRSFAAEEQADMVEADGKIRVTCEYCSTTYVVEPQAIAAV